MKTRNRSLSNLWCFPGHRLRLGALAVLSLWNCGCQNNSVAISDSGQARELINSVLDAWVSGQTPADQRAAIPPVFVADEHWEAGKSLIQYSVLDDGVLIGTNVYFDVSLSIADANGKARDTRRRYVVTTTPAMTISQTD